MNDTLKEDALLRRRELAEALTRVGFPIRGATLATMASRGGGPPYRLFGRVPLYRWTDALTWAQARTTPAETTTSGHRSAAMDEDLLARRPINAG